RRRRAARRRRSRGRPRRLAALRHRPRRLLCHRGRSRSALDVAAGRPDRGGLSLPLLEGPETLIEVPHGAGEFNPRRSTMSRIIGVLASAAAFAACSTVQVQTEYDKAANFKAYRTYAYISQQPGPEQPSE